MVAWVKVHRRTSRSSLPLAAREGILRALWNKVRLRQVGATKAAGPHDNPRNVRCAAVGWPTKSFHRVWPGQVDRLVVGRGSWERLVPHTYENAIVGLLESRATAE
jgi:hypothetical protein